MNELIVNLKNIKRNVEQKKAALKKGCRFCAVVKANAYGLGAERIATAIESDVDYFAVARVIELVRLKKSGIKKPILVLGRLFEKEIVDCLNFDGEMQASSFEELVQISKIATMLNKVAIIHLAFNTGMNRFGFSPEMAEDVASFSKSLTNICIKGVFSHFHSAANSKENEKQNFVFNSIVRHFPNCIVHIASSLASETPNYQYSMVRVGIDIYIGKHPAVSLCTTVVQTFNLKKGDSCGYSKIYTAKENEKLATISMGYADAIPRRASGSAKVVVCDEICDIVAVCMDSSIIKIPPNCPIFAGERVYVIGKCKKNSSNIFDFAASCDTIPYEILTGISQRVKRKYLYR